MTQKGSLLRNQTKMTGFDSNCADFSTQAMELGLYLLRGVLVFWLLLFWWEGVVLVGFIFLFPDPEHIGLHLSAIQVYHRL